jgi:hypothetical protein
MDGQRCIQRHPYVYLPKLRLFVFLIPYSYLYSVEFDTRISPDLIQRCRGINGVQYITFGPTRETWLGVGPNGSGIW